MEIKYDGEYPNLCSGNLIVTVDGKEWLFPEYCLSSGGSVSFDENWMEEITGGRWKVSEWPEKFPEELKEDVLDEINDHISWGCCGGCV